MTDRMGNSRGQRIAARGIRSPVLQSRAVVIALERFVGLPA
jgi:hypothetical protein